MWTSKVVWSEGMFLRPHHFQQQERYFANLVESRSAPLQPYPWGFTELKLDQQLLGLGKIALVSARGVFPDGTPFSIPDDEEPPAALEFPETAKNQCVLLSLPQRRAGMEEVDGRERRDSLARFSMLDYEVRDSNADNNSDAAMQVGKLRLRLALQGEALGAYACLALARVKERRADASLALDDGFIVPCLNHRAASPLAAFVTELCSMLQQRGEELAGVVTGRAQTGVSEITDFLLLQSVNRAQPLFAHLDQASGLHPESLYRICLVLAGDLATFARPDKRPAQFAAYRHDDLQSTFAPVMEDLRRSLRMVIERNAVSIPLEAGQFNIHVAQVADRQLFRTANFVLVANANVQGEFLRQHLPMQIKVGPVEKIRDLVNHALPGVLVRALPVVPRQIPFHAGSSYFELDRGGELWKQLERSGGMAMHVPDDFPGLKLQLWAIKG
jgi:type VI secretion system protein ImpJ